MVQTNTEYMSDMARVGRVVEKFAEMTIKELREVYSKCIDFITDVICPTMDLQPEELQALPYRFFIYWIDGVGGNSAYDTKYYNSFSEQMVEYKAVAFTLLEAGKSSIPVKMFMAIPLKAFYAYMDSISKGNRDKMGDFEYIRGRCKYREGYTIKDFLLEKIGELNKPWHPTVPLKEYAKKIRDAYDDIGMLLIYSFYGTLLDYQPYLDKRLSFNGTFPEFIE